MNTIKLLLRKAVCLMLLAVWGWQGAALHLSPVQAHPAAGPVTITPTTMTLSGDVATQANCAHLDVCAWVNASPAGSILLGVDPASPDPANWDGGAASIQLALSGYISPTVLALQISWPDQNGKGLHSPLKNQKASLTWDGKTVWDMRTVHLGDFGDYYAAQRYPILTTLVITQTITHTLTIRVPAHTAWDISLISLKPDAYPTALRGIGYSPYRDCQYPGGDVLPSQADITDDLNRLIHTSNAIRTYAATGVNAQIPALVNAYGLRMFAGAWLNPDSDDDAEIQGLLQLAQTTKLEGVIVGNEYYLRNRTPARITYLAGRIDEVKSQLPAGIVVMTAEVDDLMFIWTNGTPAINPDYRPILDRVDNVMVHIYPFWTGNSITGAAQYVVDHYLKIQTLIDQTYPGQNKRVVIGETGWPSAGAANNLAVPSSANQHRFYLEFLALADAKGVEYFYFDAFDELWKIEEPGGVGQRWGYAYADRSAKHAEYGVLLPPDLLPLPLPETEEPVSDKETPSAPAAATVIRTVYDEWPEGPGTFVPSGWMGDLDRITMYACDRTDPYSGEMALQAGFQPGGSKGWGGVYWQYPENNWGGLPEGIDLRQANQLTFRAKGQVGGEKVRFIVGGIGTQDDPYPDSLRPAASSGFITLGSAWQEYTINLKGQDLSHIIGGFGWVTERCANPQGATFYLDLIRFEYNPSLPDLPPHGNILPVYTDAAAPDNHFAPSGFMDAARDPANISLTECWLNSPHSGRTAIRIQYNHDSRWYGGGVYWVDPAENWADRPGGVDLTGVKRLTFWARSDTPGVPINFLVGGVGYDVKAGLGVCQHPTGQYPDSVCPNVQRTFTLGSDWQQYSIFLFPYLRDYQHTVGGFGFYASQDVTFYLDDILYQFDTSWLQQIFLPFVLR
jgi:exo-beta-1,3-glucanase (GH17 family)